MAGHRQGKAHPALVLWGTLLTFRHGKSARPDGRYKNIIECPLLPVIQPMDATLVKRFCGARD